MIPVSGQHAPRVAPHRGLRAAAPPSSGWHYSSTVAEFSQRGVHIAAGIERIQLIAQRNDGGLGKTLKNRARGPKFPKANMV
jgi:hypothetical protein